ncbi:MAG: PKD domain-containing protein, partial [bacterium]|nr:PKD domain-containing protein [bacterium]
ITFQVFWSDPDGDSTRIHICKTDSISGQTCSGGSWCDTASFSSSSPTSCNYTTQGGDAGQKSYWAFACDNGSPNLCSPSQSGTFLVDATAPSISSFTASPAPPAWISNGAPNATVDWSVSDTGGSNLKQIEVWRAWDQNGDDILQPGEWDNPGNGQNNPVFTKSSGFDTPSTDTDSYIDTNLLATATYWYGLHVLDNASNLTTESTPREVQVDKLNPVAVVTDPTPGDWYRDDFTATFDDSDLGSGLATNCEYEFIGLNPGGGDTTSGTLTRDCNLDTGLIGVGESPEVCQFEGASRCRVRTQAYDLAGNTSGWQPFDYGVDFTDPSVGTPGPSTAQAGVSQTYSSSLSDPVGKVASCTFFWKVSGAPEWNTGGATTIDPVPCENGGMCSVSVDHTFASSGDYDISFGCADSTLPLPANTGWGFGAVSTDSLSVTLTANPPSGVTTTLFDLTSQVAGTASGLANFKFDCTNDSLWEYEIDDINLSSTDPGWVLRNGYNTKVTAPDTFAVQDLCQYGTPDTYTANALVERGNGDAGDTADITVTPNTAPQAINLAHNNGTADYCFVSSPPIILSWTFDDDDPGDSQSAYQVQMATDAGFSNIVVDTNKVTSSNTQFSPVGLMYATTYHWRVKVWDNNDAESVPEWATGASFTTPVHAYPSPNFSWVPVFPSAEEEIQFTEDTTFAPGSTGQGWSWTFGDTGSSLLQNPTHVYAENGAYLVTLEVTDDAGSCSREKTVTVTLPFPEWQEISPF